MPNESYKPTPKDIKKAEGMLTERKKKGSEKRETELKEAKFLSKLDDKTFNEILSSYEGSKSNFHAFTARGHRIYVNMEPGRIISVYVNNVGLTDEERGQFLEKYRSVIFAFEHLSRDELHIVDTEKALDDLLN